MTDPHLEMIIEDELGRFRMTKLFSKYPGLREDIVDVINSFSPLDETAHQINQGLNQIDEDPLLDEEFRMVEEAIISILTRWSRKKKDHRRVSRSIAFLR